MQRKRKVFLDITLLVAGTIVNNCNRYMTQQDFEVCAGMKVFTPRISIICHPCFRVFVVNPGLITNYLSNLAVAVITQNGDDRPNLKESIHSATVLASNGIIGEHDIGFPIIQTSGRSEYHIVTGLSLDC